VSKGVYLLEQAGRRLIEVKRIVAYHDVTDAVGYRAGFWSLCVDQEPARRTQRVAVGDDLLGVTGMTALTVEDGVLRIDNGGGSRGVASGVKREVRLHGKTA
jgi:hypothetical protein